MLRTAATWVLGCALGVSAILPIGCAKPETETVASNSSIPSPSAVPAPPAQRLPSEEKRPSEETLPSEEKRSSEQEPPSREKLPSGEQPPAARAVSPADSLPPAPKLPPREVKILEPFDGALFPPDIVAPLFRWEDDNAASDAWLIEVRFADGTRLESRSSTREWTPSDADWETIKQRSRRSEARVTIRAVNQREPGNTIAQASVAISTSADAVDAPLFFREVNLPFLKAVKDPATHIRWRFGPISSKAPPPIVLEKLPVCGNCHSFAANGSTLAMEVDSGNDKGGYAIVPLERQMLLEPSKIITWSDYRREDKQLTFGLLCQISPDGRFVAGTVKDRALAVYRPDLMFSQLFFLVKGVLAIYDRQAKTFTALPGADDPQYVQTNATWSPDGKTIVFARSTAYEPPGVAHIQSVLCPPEAAKDFLQGHRKFLYDLCRIPFNDGKGGKAEPIAGASNNGMSNYFPKFSPDGKWIVFCRAKSFMLLQPDSELYIMPAQGGEARRLRCNTSRMNSWHSWSPNGKWLVFSSKVHTPYTQLFLTHIDEQGESSVPVVLSRMTESERAANIPEFVNVREGAIEKISAAFLDDKSFFRAALAHIYQNDLETALPLLHKSLSINPGNISARMELADAFWEQDKNEEAKAELLKVIELSPDYAVAHFRLASILREERKIGEAISRFRQALQVRADYSEAHTGLGMLLMQTGKLDESLVHFQEALRLQPDTDFGNYYCAHVLHRLGKPEEAIRHYERAVEINPTLLPALMGLASIRLMSDRPALFNAGKAIEYARKACEVTRNQNAEALNVLAGAYAVAGDLEQAVGTARAALEIARKTGDLNSIGQIQRMLLQYEQLRAERRK